MGWQTRNVLFRKVNLAAIGFEKTGEEIEYSGLARAVRPDQPGDRTLLYRERQP
ncbi:unnamed protein product, partial [marine sediment metagenome]